MLLPRQVLREAVVLGPGSWCHPGHLGGTIATYFAPFSHSPGEARCDAKHGMIGQRVDAQKLEYNITVVSPGKRAWPLHNHRVNEEMFFIIACPAGGKETAHQIINTGTEELRYLAVSTQFSHEVAEYPDSVKFAVSVERSISPDGKPQRRVFVGRESQSLKYWDGE